MLFNKLCFKGPGVVNAGGEVEERNYTMMDGTWVERLNAYLRLKPLWFYGNHPKLNSSENKAHRHLCQTDKENKLLPRHRCAPPSAHCWPSRFTALYATHTPSEHSLESNVCLVPMFIEAGLSYIIMQNICASAAVGQSSETATFFKSLSCTFLR